jgi:hypothetical protein
LAQPATLCFSSRLDPPATQIGAWSGDRPWRPGAFGQLLPCVRAYRRMLATAPGRPPAGPVRPFGRPSRECPASLPAKSRPPGW